MQVADNRHPTQAGFSSLPSTKQRECDTLRENMEKIRLRFLIRHRTGRHYARLFPDGKEIWMP